METWRRDNPEALPAPLPVRGRRSLREQEMEKILVRGVNWIGDAIMTLPALQALRQSFPHAHLTILAKPWVADIYRLSQLPDDIFIYEDPGRHEGIKGILRLSREIMERRFSAAILFQNAIEAAIIAYLSRIPVRAGYSTDGRGFLLTHAVRRKKAVKNLHQTRYYLEMVRALGAEEVSSIPRIKAPEELPFPIPASPLIGIAPGAQYGPAKRWFPERFASLADLLTETFSAQIILFGATADREVTREIVRRSKHPLLDLAGEVSLTQAIAIMSKLRVFVTNDSGLMHVASALGLPVVALFGSTNPYATGPVGSPSRVIYHPVPCSPCLRTTCPTDFRCFDLIKVEEVFAAVTELWEGKEG